MNHAAWCLVIGAFWTVPGHGNSIPLLDVVQTVDGTSVTSSYSVDGEMKAGEDRELEKLIKKFPEPVEWDYGHSFLQMIGSDAPSLSRGIIIAISAGIAVAFICAVGCVICCCRAICRKKWATVLYQAPQSLPMSGGETDPTSQEAHLQHQHWPPEGYKDPYEGNNTNEFVNPLAEMQPAAVSHAANGTNRY